MLARQPVFDRNWRTGPVAGSREIPWPRRGLFALLLLLAHVALALDPQRSLDHYGHQVWHTDSGLPQNTVHSILQTRDGYVWLGTDGGLVRFDGIDFVTFDSENTRPLKSDLIYDLVQDDAGSLWISTAAGLVRYQAGSFQSYTQSQGLPADTVWFCQQDRQHRLWAITAAGPAYLAGNRFVAVAGTEAAGPPSRQALTEDAQGMLWLGGAGGAFAIDTRSPSPRLALRLLSGSNIEALSFDAQGTLWVGGAEGLARYASGRLSAVTISGLPAKTEITALEPDGRAGMWAATAAGLVRVSAQGMASLLSGNTPATGRVDRLYVDRQETLWLATERGIFRLSAGRLQAFAAVSSLAANRVLSMYEDREGDLWLGTDSSGLHLLRDQKFTTYTTSDGLSGNLVRCVLQSANGDVWVGTDGAGLNRRTNDGFAHYTTADGLSSNVILSLAGGANGDLWIGTPDGLNLLHADATPTGAARHVRVERFTSADGLPDDFVRSLYADPDGTLWVGTAHGLAHREPGRFTSFSSLDGLPSDFIGAILRANDDLWVGTAGGLSRKHNDIFTNYTVRQGLSDNVVTAILQSKPAGESTLWLGTNGGGLNRLRQGSPGASDALLQSFPFGSRALPGTIYGMLEDTRGRLWLSSKTGIFRVSIAELNAYSAGTAQPLAVTAYDTADGMNIRECSGGGHPAAWQLSDGSLWFATLDGVSVIDPEHAAENRIPPPVVVEKVLVDDQARNPERDLVIRPGANRLEFQYAGLSFVAPQKVRYRYHLQGFDRGWIEAGNRRAAFYTNLPPGRYQFQVMAANSDGVWSTAGASVALRLLPHYYQTWWFYSALALACALLAYLVYRWRVLQVEAQFGAVLAERGRLAREIHDTLAQGFVGVSVQLELVARLLSNSREAAQEALDQARALVRASLEEARASIWNLRSQTAAEDLPARLSQSCGRLAGGSAAKVYLQVKGTYRPVARRIEDELLRIGQEAVANAVRHADAARIDVHLVYEATRVALQVEDDGCGFQPLPAQSGPEGHYGIRGMHERAGEMGATLTLESKPGAGTRVSVEAPLL